ncbi:MAG: alcohol dehydrogenase catalytic domain-containing protein [Candidatus Binatia bacterium]
MLALVLEENRVFLQEDRAPADHREGYVRVRTRLAGICSTDLELARGYMGFSGVLGHEFVGEALEGRFEGRRVVGGINFGCGRCRDCAHGDPRHCVHRTVLGIEGADGALAEEFMIPERNLLSVPDSIGDEAAVFAEPLAAACEILEQLPDRRPCTALVLGDGKLGLLVSQVLATYGFAVNLVGHHLGELGWLRERGVKLVGCDPEGERYPLVIDATGSTSGLETALAATEPRGTVVLKTTVAGRHHVDFAPVVINELTILGSRCGPFEPALRLLAEGRVDVGPLVSERHPLGNAEEAFRRAATAEVCKVLVEGV